MSSLRRSFRVVAVAAALAASTGAGWGQFGWFDSGRTTTPAPASGNAPQDDKGVLASLISRALSTPATRVSIGAVEGALSSDATIRDIQISDRDGVWLKLDRARIVWRRLALLQRRLEIDELTLGTLEVSRKPIPAEGPVPAENEPILPELPVKVEVKGFTLGTLALGEPVLGTAARLTANGRARLSNEPKEGLDLTFDARRLDRPGTLALRLGLVPQGEKLDVTVKVDEPEGGLIARAGNIPGLPPVTLDVEGRGTLDKFDAKLAFKAGDGIGADGTATILRQGTARDVTLDLAARIEGLLPEIAAPVFAGTTRLTGRTSFADDGAITIPDIKLAAAAARLDVSGSIRDGNADLTVAAENVPNRSERTAAGGAEIRKLTFNGRVVGPFASPRIDADLKAEDARLPAGRLARLEASVRSTPAGQDGAGRTRMNVTADARASGVAPADAALARALGDTLTLVLRGTVDTGGTLNVERMTVTTPTVGLRYAGTLGSEEMRGRLGVSAENLRAFADIAKLRLAGSANLEADLEGAPRANRFAAKLDGNVARFGTGIAQVDNLFGGKLALAGGLRMEPDGVYRFENLTLGGQYLDARVDGTLRQESADLSVTGTVPDLKRVDPRVTGRGTLQAKVTGGIAAPNLQGDIALVNGSALGRAIPRLVLGVDAKDVTGALDATLKLDGTIDGKPARGGLRVARPDGGATVIDGLDLTVGSAKAKGAVTLDPNYLAKGALDLDVPNLDELSPLVLQTLSGTVRADVSLDNAGGGQSAKIKAAILRLSAFGVTVSKADADLSVTDIYRRPVIAGRASVDEAKVAGETITRVRLDAVDSGNASDVTASAVARGFTLDTRARVLPGDRTRIEIASLSATRGRERLALTGPATVTLVEGGADLRNVSLALGSGSLTVNGLAGSRLDLRAEAKGVPLSIAEMVSPGLGIGGTFEGQARIEGTPSAPAGEYRARVDNLTAPQLRSLNLGRVDVTANGRLSGGRATVDAAVTAGRAGTIRIGGSVPAGAAGALDVTINGSLDAAAATTGLLAAGGRRLTGRVEIDARVGGTLNKPEASGSATLGGGTFTDASQGVTLSNIQARVVARGEEIVIEPGQASTRNGGLLNASGRVRLDPGAGFPGEIRINGRNAELVRSAIVTAVVDLDLALSGALARDPRVSGRVAINSAEVAIPERLPASLKPLENTRHKNPTRTTSARLALEGKAKGKKGRGAAPPPFDARLDIVLAVPGSIRVRGRGLNAQLGGSLRLGGTLAKPAANGGFNLQRGTLQVATARLDFSRGILTFTGSLTPELDFVANTNAGGAAIAVVVSGPADDPQFAFTSSPDLPQDEVLSRLLFNSPSGQLSAFQAIALAQAAAQFSGSDGAFEGLRRSLGLSGLDVGIGPGGLTGGLQRALGDRVSVGVRGGASAAQTGIGVDVRITDEIKVQGDVTAGGGSSVGVGAQYEW